jgi:DNA-binding transcriptional MerR regulator
MNTSRDSEQSYRIGSVARLTGINPDTLRMWERRYGVVDPMRTPGGGRLYTCADVERLKLIKQLVDGGDAIGSIASLATAVLLQRWRETSEAAITATARRSCRIIVAGETLAARMQDEVGAGALEGLQLLAAGPSPESCLAALAGEPADVLVIEIPTVHEDTSRQIIDWLGDTGTRRALLVYRFATAEALRRLPAARIQTVSAPVSPVVIRNLCLGMQSLAVAGPEGEEAGVRLQVAGRRYSNAMLAKLAQRSGTIRCECPKHLAELVTSLLAFERYSLECENRNRADAALHAYLHATVSQARKQIEDALAHVIDVEGIDRPE